MKQFKRILKPGEKIPVTSRKVLVISTMNSQYLLEREGNTFFISGNEIYCPEPVECFVLAVPELGKPFVYRIKDAEHRIITSIVRRLEVETIEGRTDI